MTFSWVALRAWSVFDFAPSSPKLVEIGHFELSSCPILSVKSWIQLGHITQRNHWFSSQFTLNSSRSGSSLRSWLYLGVLNHRIWCVGQIHPTWVEINMKVTVISIWSRLIRLDISIISKTLQMKQAVNLRDCCMQCWHMSPVLKLPNTTHCNKRDKNVLHSFAGHRTINCVRIHCKMWLDGTFPLLRFSHPGFWDNSQEFPGNLSCFFAWCETLTHAKQNIKSHCQLMFCSSCLFQEILAVSASNAHFMICFQQKKRTSSDW